MSILIISNKYKKRKNQQSETQYKMDVKNLMIAPSAQIFSIIKRISKRQLTDLFTECSEKKIGKYILDYKKIPLDIDGRSIFYSVMAFKLEDQPNFLIETSIKEIRYAYLLIVEYNKYAFIFKKHLNSTCKCNFLAAYN